MKSKNKINLKLGVTLFLSFSFLIVFIEKHLGSLQPKIHTDPLSWNEVMDRLPDNLLFALILASIITYLESQEW